MNNFQIRFEKWREKMLQKSEKERHNFSIRVAAILTFILAFVVASNWYSEITGGILGTTLLEEMEGMIKNVRE